MEEKDSGKPKVKRPCRILLGKKIVEIKT